MTPLSIPRALEGARPVSLLSLQCPCCGQRGKQALIMTPIRRWECRSTPPALLQVSLNVFENYWHSKLTIIQI